MYWPKYELEDPQNLRIDANATKLFHRENDDYRAEEIDYIISVFN
jgi:hypothetical protein